MKLIVKPRGLGKTTDLIRLAAVTKIPILCYNTAEERIMWDRCKECNIDPKSVRVILWKDLKNIKGQFNFNEPIYIDEITHFIQMVLSEYGFTCEIGTLSFSDTN